jgi:hypothetical protein
MKNWGIGVEHEMHFFTVHNQHKEYRNLAKILSIFYPSNDNILNKLKDVNLSKIIQKEYELTDNEIKLFMSSNIDPKLENSGKRCADLIPPKANMLELINVDYKNRTIPSIKKEFMHNTKIIMDVVKKVSVKEKLIDNNETIILYPYGATIFFDKLRDSVMKDYTGSWQFTITLPHEETISLSAFIYMHEKFCNQMQWLEPLIAACLFAPDPSCVLDEGYAFCAYRTLRYGWGNFAGSDIRRLHKGIGRKANVEAKWRNGLSIRNLASLNSEKCMSTEETHASKFMDPLSGKFGHISSDFRTFGIEDGVRASGTPMSVGQGVEFRIFDNFDIKHLDKILSLLIIIAQNTDMCKYTDKVVYNDKHWNQLMKDVILNGWIAKPSEEYIKKLKTVLEIELPNDEYKDMHSLMNDIATTLQIKTRNGHWLKLMCGHSNISPKLPNLNKAAWLHFFKSSFNTKNRRFISEYLQKFIIGKKYLMTTILKGLSNRFIQSQLHKYILSDNTTFKVEGKHVKIMRKITRPLTAYSTTCDDKSSFCLVSFDIR